MLATSEPVTELLLRRRAGNQECLNQLIPLVEGGLQHIARHYMRMEAKGRTLQTTALVNEAYLKLVDQARANWQKQSHFLGVARLMRYILVDHARGLCRGNRGGGLSVEEAAEALGVHSNTAKRGWRLAQVWLKRELSPKGAHAG